MKHITMEDVFTCPDCGYDVMPEELPEIQFYGYTPEQWAEALDHVLDGMDVPDIIAHTGMHPERAAEIHEMHVVYMNALDAQRAVALGGK